ncbi:MAG: transcriptional regulator [Candidatus Omnitrophica bacterium CG11_big_fil_rev_8_21_14_0_20_64_10]|nr:MAG: transcriptional regulator [Candidatus Omnitrophica bacterium CG11_big_fil_rev_8_21_14_0_20_64_10]
MPAKKPIGAELTQYKKLLLKKKEEVLAAMKHIESENLRSQRDASGDLSAYSIHMADTATDSYDREFSLGLASNAQKILYGIEEALKRIQEKKFGLCVSCEKPITKKRLKAIPYAALCIACQSRQETERRAGSPGGA